MLTSPDAHNSYIRKADERSGGKLRKTVQLVKYWRECRTPRIPISSFHLDLLLAAHGTCEGVKSYAQCVADAFALLNSRQCRAFRDPLGISGDVSAVKMGAQREAAANAASYASSHAQSAILQERLGSAQEAKRQWDLVFNGKFPF